MRLSILIATYNCDCLLLVQQLHSQLPDDSEIIVGDDCSTDLDTVRKNSTVASLPRCRIYRPDRNLGRAAIRNALACEAKGEWLLFVDADAEVRSHTFISAYLAATAPSAQAGAKPLVVCGGTGNLPQLPRPEARLRYDYEVAAEKRLTLQYRQSHPYAQFTTFNFLISRSLFLAIRFDDSLHSYGHEDTLFGLALKQRGVAICHIDNKLTHLGIEDADTYLAKTETALRTLSTMSPSQQQHVRVSALALSLRNWHLLGPTRLLFRLTKPLLRRNLLGRHPSQLLFAFYKLGYYSHLASEH